MEILIFVVCLLASCIGGICGIGGGVIIKPVIDVLGIMEVSTISFLSGLTVLSMSVVSTVKQRKEKLVEKKTSGFLAAGAVLGGIGGNWLFQLVISFTKQEAIAGMLQSILLGIVTLLTLIYSCFLLRKITTCHLQNPIGCTVLGAALGIMSSFLGIGGGPISLAALSYAFSFDTKKAAANSLYIIMFSQIANLVTAIICKNVPDFQAVYLCLMVIAGMAGGIMGTSVNKHISNRVVEKLYVGVLILIIFICCFNTYRFSC